MTIINGRYYMNPQYGAALERDRANGAPQPSWLDRFLGFAPADGDQEQISQGDASTTDVSRQTSASGDPDELDAQNRSSNGAQQNQSQNTNPQMPHSIAATAGKYSGSTDWAYAAQKGAFAPYTNKCNAFVGDVTKEAGAAAFVTGSDGKVRYPLAAEWADRNTKIPNWRVLGPNEQPQPGDVAAYKLPGGGRYYSGHSGIVTSVDPDGTVHGMAAHDTVVGPDNKFQPDSTQHMVVFRRYAGGQ
jgi:CHAP domain-containing protein